MRRFLSYGPAFVVLLAAGAVLIAAPAAIRRMATANTEVGMLVARRGLQNDDILERVNTAVRNVSTIVTPSVVHLEVEDPESRFRSRGSSGAGWIYDNLGHIITNAHVVSGATEVGVQLHDGQVLQGTVIGTDPAADIAVIRVQDASSLIPAQRATGERLQVGDRVFAFGSPFGFKFSMSEGIVSGLGRTARTAMGFSGISNYIQTDAAVNPGNSGGPLSDVRGKIVGMNVAIATAQEPRGNSDPNEGIGGQSAGISFAIPLRTIESRVEVMIKGEPVIGAFMGITTEFDQIVGESDGIRVSAVVADGPGDKAGLRAGDVVIEIDGQPVREWSIFRSIVSSRRPGDVVAMKYRRDDVVHETTVTLGSQPLQSQAALMGEVLLRQIGLEVTASARGPMVQRVLTSWPAGTAGLKPGQLIVSVDGESMREKTPEELVLLLRDKGLFRGRVVELQVMVPDEEGATPTAVRLRAKRMP
jgi:serine protease Do